MTIALTGNDLTFDQFHAVVLRGEGRIGPHASDPFGGPHGVGTTMAPLHAFEDEIVACLKR